MDVEALARRVDELESKLSAFSSSDSGGNVLMQIRDQEMQASHDIDTSWLVRARRELSGYAVMAAAN